jgi:acetyltransferase-like isoleucine patch superfamily enzyme
MAFKGLSRLRPGANDSEAGTTSAEARASYLSAGRVALALLLLRPALHAIGLLACSALSRILDKKEEDLMRFRDEREGEEEDAGWRPIGVAARTVNGLMRYMAIWTGRIPSHTIRMLIYRKVFLLKAERNVVIHGGAEIRSAYNIMIGEGSIIGDEAKLDGRRGIEIGRYVNLSTGIWIWTLEHDPQSPSFSCRGRGGRVTVNDRAWLSAGTIVLSGTTVGEGAVTAAGSVVTEDLEPYSINAGVPARKVGERSRNLTYVFDGSHQPFL